jgi:hypothetical protein
VNGEGSILIVLSLIQEKNDLYLNIVSNAMSGSTAEEQTTNYEKNITKVAGSGNRKINIII